MIINLTTFVTCYSIKQLLNLMKGTKVQNLAAVSKLFINPIPA